MASEIRTLDPLILEFLGLDLLQLLLFLGQRLVEGLDFFLQSGDLIFLHFLVRFEGNLVLLELDCKVVRLLLEQPDSFS